MFIIIILTIYVAICVFNAIYYLDQESLETQSRNIILRRIAREIFMTPVVLLIYIVGVAYMSLKQR